MFASLGVVKVPPFPCEPQKLVKLSKSKSFREKLSAAMTSRATKTILEEEEVSRRTNKNPALKMESRR